MPSFAVTALALGAGGGPVRHDISSMRGDPVLLDDLRRRLATTLDPMSAAFGGRKGGSKSGTKSAASAKPMKGYGGKKGYSGKKGY